MLAYYDERAPEYEDAYTRGTGTASIPDPDVFVTEAKLLAAIVREFAGGRLIDLACGTGYWLPFYADRCSHITLFDQSEKMLAESRTKLDRLGLGDRSTVLQGDFFDQAFGSTRYDCALVGFFLSHLTESQEPLLFHALRAMLGSSGRFLLLDSAWSEERARFNAKLEQQTRHLNDGTSFEIYKRYCDRGDVLGWARKHDAALRLEHFGTAFFAVSGRFNA
jgi:demethylmenaquinone methyltransferase/2-methoxy-6-polyprenyl-1,4-benzoquinol methylase